MEISTSSKKIEIYKGIDYDIGKINIEFSQNLKNISFNSLGTIILLDRSCSIGSITYIIARKILPNVFSKLNYNDNNKIFLITFSDSSELIEFSINDLKKYEVFCQGKTNISPALSNLLNIFEKEKFKKYRILIFTDGDFNDDEIVHIKLEQLLIIVENYKLKVNLQIFKIISFDEFPNSNSLLSILQISNTEKGNIYNLIITKNYEILINDIYKLFTNDCLDFEIHLKLIDNKNYFLEEPWSVKSNFLNVYFGENIFWLDKKLLNEYNKFDNPFELVYNKNNKEQISFIEKCNLSIDNYKKIIHKKIKFYFKRIKTLKILNTKESLEKLNKIINYFSKFESNLSEIQKHKLDTKISSRLMYLKKNIQRRKYSITIQLSSLQSGEKISKLNELQKSKFLRKINQDKLSKELVKRAFISGINFDKIAKEEILNISNHINELSDIDDSNHTISFYSTCTTLEGIRNIAQIPKHKKLFKNITALDTIKLLNIVGIAINSLFGNYPNASIQIIKNIYFGTFISVSDILMASECNNGEDLLCEIGNKCNVINNAIPYFDDERIHIFLKKYSPKLLEYNASIGMRKILCDIPNTFKYSIICGVYKIFCYLFLDNKEIICRLFVNLCKSVLNEISDFKNIKIIINQKYDSDNYLIFIPNYNIIHMINHFIFFQRNIKDDLDKKIIHRCLRAIVIHEIHKYIKQKYNPLKLKDELICEFLNIDIEKDKIKLNDNFINDDNEPVIKVKYSFNFNKLDENKQFIEKLKKSILIPKILNLSFEDNAVEKLKQLNFHELKNDENLEKELNINYPLKEYILFSFIQSIIFMDNNKRFDIKKSKMKIIDLNIRDNGILMIENFINSLFSFKYFQDKNKKKKIEMSILSEKLVEKCLSTENENEYLSLLKNGISINNRTYLFKNFSSKGFPELYKRLIEDNNIPLRKFKIKILIKGKDSQNNIIWNKGNIITDKIILEKAKKIFNENEWEKIINNNNK